VDWEAEIICKDWAKYFGIRDKGRAKRPRAGERADRGQRGLDAHSSRKSRDEWGTDLHFHL